MKKKYYYLFAVIMLFIATGSLMCFSQGGEVADRDMEKIKLPEPLYEGGISVEEALKARRSVRDYNKDLLTLSDVSQLLWAAQGITNDRGYRTAPSAGALYPLEIYILVANVQDLSPGIYKYNPSEHELICNVEGDKRNDLAEAAFGQDCVRNASIVIVFAGVYERVTQKYGEMGIKATHMEAGHASQNVYLQALSLKLGTVAVGGFDVDKTEKAINMEEEEEALYMMPVGKF